MADVIHFDFSKKEKLIKPLENRGKQILKQPLDNIPEFSGCFEFKDTLQYVSGFDLTSLHVLIMSYQANLNLGFDGKIIGVLSKLYMLAAQYGNGTIAMSDELILKTQVDMRTLEHLGN